MSSPQADLTAAALDGPQVDAAAVDSEPDAPVRGRRSGFRALLRRPLAVAAMVFLLAVIAVAVFAGQLAPFSPTDTDLTATLTGPSGAHWLGTDDLGRDILSRLIYASRISLLASLIAVGVAVLTGVPLGLLSGYLGGWRDSAIMRLNDSLMAFPALILAITIVGILGPGLVNVMVAVGVVFAPRFIRLTRGATLAVREETYVKAAEMMGVSTLRIIWLHVLPNVRSPLIVQTTLALGEALLAEASLSFIGLGVQPPDASWGSMLGTAFRYLQQDPTYAVSSGVCIVLVVLAYNALGDGIREAFGGQRER